MLFNLPFSPRWLVEKHRVDEARDVLVRLNAEDVEGVLGEIVESLRHTTDVVQEKLWQRKYSIPILGAVALAVVTVAVLTGVEFLESSVRWLTRGAYRRE